MNISRTKPQYDYVTLVLQGGGALGAYQAGVFEGMTEAGYLPDWITGVSMGAINGASWSRHEIHAGTFVNSDHEARVHQISRRSGQRYHDFGAIALRDKIR